MDDMNVVLAKNLKNLRDRHRLSLDKVAELSGVSKTMLGQIERGESNPTINTVWKIANGLKTSFTSLINEPVTDAAVITSGQVQVLVEDNGKCRYYAYFPFDEKRRFEMYTIEMDKGGYLSSEPHREGTEESVTIFEGELTIRVNQEEYTVKKGDAIRFLADRSHSYHNSGHDMVRLSMVIHYPNGD
jgi:transcriptional regulator with XRE-family HTH domain